MLNQSMKKWIDDLLSIRNTLRRPFFLSIIFLCPSIMYDKVDLQRKSSHASESERSISPDLDQRDSSTLEGGAQTLE